MAQVNLISYIGKVLFPPGSIYITSNASITTAKLQQFYGGTWSKITTTTTGCMVAAAGSSFPRDTTFGTNDGRIPSHTHTVTAGGTHTHSAKYRADSSYAASADVPWSGTSGATTLNSLFYSSGTHTHTMSSITAGNSYFPVRTSATDLNVPPYVTVNYFYRSA